MAAGYLLIIVAQQFFHGPIMVRIFLVLLLLPKLEAKGRQQHYLSVPDLLSWFQTKGVNPKGFVKVEFDLYRNIREQFCKEIP